MNATNISVSSFGTFEDHPISQYTLENANGMQVKIINYGATITSITLPDANGDVRNLACGFDSMAGYLSEKYRNNAPYFGCTVGRCASRIKNGKFTIDDQEYSLAINNGSNHLHGGIKAFDKEVWKAELIETNDKSGVRMDLHSPHMEEGYPGNVDVSVFFSLNDDNEITIEYCATTDRKTPLSLTNHTYFNLSGFTNSIVNHEVKILASQILVPDESNVPDGEIASVEGSVDDLREGARLGDCFQELETGFEHYYIFDKPHQSLEKVAEIVDAESGLGLEISTSEPGVLFYTGYFTSDDLSRENGDEYGKFRGLCFETSRYPNGVNITNAPGAIISPDQEFHSTTIFKIKDGLFS